MGLGVGTGVGREVGTEVGPGVRTSVGRDVGTEVGPGVGRDVGTEVGPGVGTGVGRDVGTEVGPGLGAGVGRDVGTAVGPGVGTGVGRDVGTEVGPKVGTEVGPGVGTGVGREVRIEVGTGVGTEVGGMVGTEVVRSSTNIRPSWSPEFRSTLIVFWSPPSESLTSVYPDGVDSRTTYVPGLTHANVNLPSAPVTKVCTTVPFDATRSTVTLRIGVSPVLSLLISSKTVPVIRLHLSSTKLLPVEFWPGERLTRTLPSKRSPSVSLTSKGSPDGFDSFTE